MPASSSARLHAWPWRARLRSSPRWPGPKVKTYNLVVADWNTYFVGRGKLLVHDITLPGPTTTEVPGLKMW